MVSPVSDYLIWAVITVRQEYGWKRQQSLTRGITLHSATQNVSQSVGTLLRYERKLEPRAA